MHDFAVQFEWIRYFNCRPDWYFHPDEEYIHEPILWFVNGGACQLDHLGQKRVLIPGDAVLFKNRETPKANHDPDNPLQVTVIHFNFIDASKGKLAAEEIDFPDFIRVGDPAFFQELLGRVAEAFERDDLLTTCRWMMCVLSELLAQHETHSMASNHRHTLIQNFCQKIGRHPEIDPDFPALARELGISLDRLSKVFKQSMGLSQKEFVLQKKIESARTLLLSSNHSVSRIAQILNYSDVYYFSKQFKKRTGQSPAAFRKVRSQPNHT